MAEEPVRPGDATAGRAPTAIRRPSPLRRLWYILLLLQFPAVLVPAFYARATPELWGFPFFYWYQLLWVPIVALVSWCAYLLSNLARGGEPTATTGPGGSAPDGGQAGPGDAPPLPKRVPPTGGGG